MEAAFSQLLSIEAVCKQWVRSTIAQGSRGPGHCLCHTIGTEVPAMASIHIMGMVLSGSAVERYETGTKAWTTVTHGRTRAYRTYGRSSTRLPRTCPRCFQRGHRPRSCQGLISAARRCFPTCRRHHTWRTVGTGNSSTRLPFPPLTSLPRQRSISIVLHTKRIIPTFGWGTFSLVGLLFAST